MCMSFLHRGLKKGARAPGTGVKDGFIYHSGCWKSNPRPLKEQAASTLNC